MNKDVKRLEERIAQLETELADANRVQAEHLAQLECYRKAAESGRDGIAVYDKAFRLQYCNQNYKNLFKHLGHLLLPGVSLREIAHHTALSGLIPEAESDVEAWIRRRTDVEQRTIDEPQYFRMADGTWIRACDSRIDGGGLLAVRTDVTELKKREAELEAKGNEMQSILQAFFENSPVPMVVKGIDRRYEVVNAAFEKFHGVSADEVIGKTIEEALPSLASELGRSLDHAILDGAGPISREHNIFPAESGTSTVASTKFPILNADGQISAIGGISIDITRFIDMQEKLAAKSELLETTLRSIDQGFAVFDSDLRILACNQHFFELHNYPNALPAEGIHMRDMLVHFAEAGAFGDQDPEGEVERRYRLLASSDRPERKERVQSDGTILDVRRKNLAGGGYVASFTDITDLKHAEQRTENAHRLLREILDTMISSVCLYDANQRMVYSNQGTTELFGWQSALLTPGTRYEDHVRDALKKEMVCGIEGPYEEWLQQRLHDFTDKKTNILTELPGDQWVISHFRAMSDGGTVAIHRDITDQKRAERALRESEENFRSLVENTEIGISISVRRNLLFVNDAFARIFGYDSREDALEAGHYDKFIAPDDLDRVRAISDARTEDRPAPTVYEFEGIRKDGTTLWLERTSRMVNWHGTRATLGTVIDVTQRHDAEERLRAALDAAETANRAKSDFLAKMSHELRTPLNAIIGFSEVLGRETFGPLGNSRYGNYVDDIALSGRHLLEMINDILDMSKIETGGYEIEPVESDIMPIVTEAVHVVNGQIEQRSIDLALAIAPDTPPLYADQRAIKQILLNLLSNAIKYTPEGGKITLSAAPNDAGGIVMSVSDSGVGIAKNDLDAVLKPFNQGSNPHSTVQPGTGLGLPIVLSLTEMHGGKLTIDSELGVGTTVTIELPNRPGAISEQKQAG